MPENPTSVPQLKRFVKLFFGSSFPVEVETTDGQRVIIKMRGAGNGVSTLLSEFVVNRMAHKAGFPVPDVIPVRIPDQFPWEFGTDEFDHLVQRSFGVNLGISFLEVKRQLSPADVSALPLSLLQQLVAIDALFCNYDRTTTSTNVLEASDGIYILDHGSCLFLDPAIGAKPVGLPAHHLLKSREEELLNPELMLRLGNPDHLETLLPQIPLDWLEACHSKTDQIRTRVLARVASSQL